MHSVKLNINIVTLIVLVIGLFLIIIGLIFGAKTGFYIDQTGIQFEKTGKRYRIDKNIGEIDQLDIESSFTEIELKIGDQNRVVATGTKKSDQPNIEVRNKKLYINHSKQKGFLIGFFHFPDRHAKITIYLTKDTKLNTSTMDISFGSVIVDQLTTKNFKIESSFSEITTNTITDKLIIDSSFGEVNATIAGASKVDVSSSFGETNLDIKGKRSEYLIEKDSSFGDIDIESNQNNQNATPNGTIFLDNSFGDINLRFLN